MPAYSSVRKTSLIANPSLDSSSQQRRTTSGRAIRANTTRPANYYARPFANAQDEPEELPQIGFFPAVTFFTDAISSLPNEVVRQFTLMKEVEAKIHGPAEQLSAKCDELMQFDVPRRRENQTLSAALMSFTAPNSAAGSANASVINGVLPNASRNGQDSANGSVTGDESVVAQDSEETFSKRQKCAELRMLAQSLIPNMDEKNVVLSEAIRVLNLQLQRIDEVMPHVEAEIPEEARLGSMTHWAYSDNRVKTKAAQSSNHRRDVMSANNLAAAAHAVHETEIAQTRREAGREAARERQGKGKHREDSEFEDKPKKAGKIGKGKLNATGLGISSTNGEIVKRRKVEKGVVPQNLVKNAKSGRETPRSIPTEELLKKNKPKPAPVKRRGLNSAQASPALGNSPLSVQIPQDSNEPAAAASRPQSARLRQGSTASNLRHERKAESRPSSAVERVASTGLEKVNGRKRGREEAENDTADIAVKTTEGEGLQKDDMRPHPSRSNSSNKTPSGRASKVGTPRSENFPADPATMQRTRSTRSTKRDERSSAEPPPQKGHKRNVGAIGSMSGLMKQIAPFNKSPDLDRRRSGDSSDSLDSSDTHGDGKDEDENGAKRRRSEPQSSRPTSRSAPRAASRALDQENGRDERDGSVEDNEMMDAVELPAQVPDVVDEEDDREASPPLTEASLEAPADDIDADEPEAGLDDTIENEDEADDEAHDMVNGEEENAVEEEDDEEGDDLDPDDPDEPKYCYCLRGSYGDMVGCDNTRCPREWFHLGCTDLTEMPSEAESWFCNFCRPKLAGNNRRGNGRNRGK